MEAPGEGASPLCLSWTPLWSGVGVERHHEGAKSPRPPAYPQPAGEHPAPQPTPGKPGGTLDARRLPLVLKCSQPMASTKVPKTRLTGSFLT